MIDPRIQHLRDLLINVQEYPAEHDDDFLAEVSNLTQQIRGIVETERLFRATQT